VEGAVGFGLGGAGLALARSKRIPTMMKRMNNKTNTDKTSTSCWFLMSQLTNSIGI
jgi:hypothetical protein